MTISEVIAEFHAKEQAFGQHATDLCRARGLVPAEWIQGARERASLKAAENVSDPLRIGRLHALYFDFLDAELGALATGVPVS